LLRGIPNHLIFLAPLYFSAQLIRFMRSINFCRFYHFYLFLHIASWHDSRVDFYIIFQSCQSCLYSSHIGSHDVGLPVRWCVSIYDTLLCAHHQFSNYCQVQQAMHCNGIKRNKIG